MSVPPHASRPSRETGHQTRRALLNAAAELFAERGFRAVSVSDIASEAGAFPSQVTYYFGSKEALFVEAACLEILKLGSRMEGAARQAKSPEGLVRELLRMAIQSPALLAYVEAVVIVHRRPELAPVIERALTRLYIEGERALLDLVGARGFDLGAPPNIQIRVFWATILGTGLEVAAGGRLVDFDATEAALLSVFRAAPPGTRQRTPKRSRP